MLTGLAQQFATVINWLQVKVLSLNIGGVTLLWWLILIVLITGFATLLMSFRPSAHIYRQRTRDSKAPANKRVKGSQSGQINNTSNVDKG